MLTKNEYKRFGASLTIFTKFKFTLTEWRKNSFVLVESKWRRIFAIYQTVIQILHLIFLIYRIKKCYPDKVVQMLLNVFLFIVHIANFAFKSPMWIYPREFTQLLNQALGFNREFGKMLPAEDSINKTREFIFTLTIVACNCSTFSTWIQCGLSNYDEFSSYKTFLLYLCFISPYWIDFWINLNYSISSFMIVLFTLNFWLKKICVTWIAEPDRTDQKSISRIFMLYRCIILLNNQLNKAFGEIFVPLFKLVLIYCALVATFVVIRLRHVVPFYIYSLFICYTFTIYILTMPAAMFMSTMYNVSSQFNRKVLLSIGYGSKERNDLKFIQKTLSSIPIVKSRVGEFYVMEGYAKLTLFDTIARGIASMLITFQGL